MAEKGYFPPNATSPSVGYQQGQGYMQGVPAGYPQGPPAGFPQAPPSYDATVNGGTSKFKKTQNIIFKFPTRCP